MHRRARPSDNRGGSQPKMAGVVPLLVDLAKKVPHLPDYALAGRPARAEAIDRELPRLRARLRRAAGGQPGVLRTTPPDRGREAVSVRKRPRRNPPPAPASLGYNSVEPATLALPMDAPRPADAERSGDSPEGVLALLELACRCAVDGLTGSPLPTELADHSPAAYLHQTWSHALRAQAAKEGTVFQLL